MRVLFIGDIVGNPGRRIIREKIPQFRKEKRIDFVVANGENAAGGLGITEKTALEIFDSGVDCITSGDHLWSKKEIILYLQQETRILRPANYPPDAPGRGARVFTLNGGERMGVLSLQGRIFLKEIDCPFRTALLEIERLNSEFRNPPSPLTLPILVDIHAEATSEKIALAWYLD